MSSTESKKRGAYLHIGRDDNGIPIPARTRPVWITGYGKAEGFACRLEISAAGIVVYTGTKGRKKLGDFTWEEFVDQLKK
jgi:hypothetical protein